ncbi:ATP-dependent acyl-CoA ligase [Pigmentiphaga soli]|uniref:ATP-dependent acyl-CoA ligase n=1 Tax=Pigmentiphaga soli TaxID=1007095 RepID=A0ABP8HHE2_9BURK
MKPSIDLPKHPLAPLEVLRSYPPHEQTLHALFASRLARDPARPFILFGDTTLSWQDFDDAVVRLAHALRARGVKQGDRIAVISTNHPAHVLLLFALARIRAIMVPADPKFGVTEARYVFSHAGVSGVFCSADTHAVAAAACEGMAPAPWFCAVDGGVDGLPELDAEIAAAPLAPLADDASPDDTCLVVYSSGTTGFPKGVMHSQRTVVLCGERQIARVHLQPDDRCMCVLPMFHVNALLYSVAGAAAAGCCLVIMPRFSASQFWRSVVDTGTTQVNLLMAMTTILTRRPRSEFVPGHKLRCVSGSPFTRETMDAFLHEFGVARVIEGFGMTEIPGAFSNPYDGPHRLASMGVPGKHPDPDMPWTQARVLDDEGRPVPDGVTGELAVKIPTIMQGYLNDPAQTAAAFRDGWFLSGDLVYRDPDDFFFFVARKKDIIRRRGENIAGAELDRVIGEHPQVAEVAAIPVPSELGEEEIMAVVVRKPGADLPATAIRDWCAARLAAYKVPRFVVFVDELPHTPTHKVAKFALRSDASLRQRAVDVSAAG